MCLVADICPSIGFLLPLPSTGMYYNARKNEFIMNEDAYQELISKQQDLSLNITKMSDARVRNLIA